MRRLTTLAILAGTLMAMLAAPSGASAAMMPIDPCLNLQNQGADIMCRRPAPTPLAPLTHKGWTYLNLNYCPPNLTCAALYRISTPAWSWTNNAWSQTSLKGGWVYTWPYTGSWRWAWTQQSGWVAVTGGRFELRPFAAIAYA